MALSFYAATTANPVCWGAVEERGDVNDLGDRQQVAARDRGAFWWNRLRCGSAADSPSSVGSRSDCRAQADQPNVKCLDVIPIPLPEAFRCACGWKIKSSPWFGRDKARHGFFGEISNGQPFCSVQPMKLRLGNHALEITHS